MLRSDNYSLKYEVTTDTAEEGFKYNTEYPANGNTDLFYKDENDEEKSNEIKVPVVDAFAKEPEKFEISFKKGQASNISFMLIDEEGNVEFIEKIDIEKQTSFEIPAEEGKISAVFVKQSTSGMLWFSEEVDQDIVDAALACVKKNNKSFKACDAIAFGAGDHDLEFKKNKFVTYTFEGGSAVIDDEMDMEEEIAEPETTPAEPETMPEAKEPTLNVAVDGAEVASWLITDEGVTVVYIAAEGKVPAVIWTSKEVNGDMADIINELGADTDAEIISGEGSHKIEYQHNKNKKKTVTYTFEII